MSFDSLALPQHLLRAVAARGYQVPTPVQQESIPHILSGSDVLAEARTGTGKTAAFALPILCLLGQMPQTTISTLVLVPTRELAVQVASEFKSYARFSPTTIRIMAVIGGESIVEQTRGLANQSVQIVVATPGRLIDLLDRDALSLSALRILVLDEADKLLNLGFADQLQSLLESISPTRQTLLFSATLPADVLSLGATVLVDPVSVHIHTKLPIAEQISQRVIEVNPEKRRGALKYLADTEKWSQVLVFVASKRAAHNLSKKLRRDGFTALALHGDLEQSERTEVLAKFKRGKHQILVATDIACRGIDIQHLSCVINYDLPRSPTDYIHRIGRTARAGDSGVAISFIDHNTRGHFQLIEKRYNIALEREQLADFPLTGQVTTSKGAAPTKGRRKSKKDKLREQAKKTP